MPDAVSVWRDAAGRFSIGEELTPRREKNPGRARSPGSAAPVAGVTCPQTADAAGSDVRRALCRSVQQLRPGGHVGERGVVVHLARCMSPVSCTPCTVVTRTLSNQPLARRGNHLRLFERDAEAQPAQSVVDRDQAVGPFFRTSGRQPNRGVGRSRPRSSLTRSRIGPASWHRRILHGVGRRAPGDKPREPIADQFCCHRLTNTVAAVGGVVAKVGHRASLCRCSPLPKPLSA